MPLKDLKIDLLGEAGSEIKVLVAVDLKDVFLISTIGTEMNFFYDNPAAILYF